MRVVDDLKKAGPYYTGEFEENWVVEPRETSGSLPTKSHH